MTAEEMAQRAELSVELTGAFTVGRLGAAMGLPGGNALMTESANLLGDLALVPALPAESGALAAKGAAAVAALWTASGRMLKGFASSVKNRPLLWASSLGVVTLSAGGYAWMTEDETVRLEAIRAQMEGISKAIDAVAQNCEAGNAEACAALSQYIKDASENMNPPGAGAGYIFPALMVAGLIGIAYYLSK